MSTDLYGVRVLELEPDCNRARFRIFVVYYDTGDKSHAPLPDDASFFLRILWDKCKSGPLSQEVRLGEICDEAFVDSNTHRYVKRFERLTERNYPLKSYKGISDFYYEREGRWKDEDLLVQADYDVFVTDVKYLAHLTTGMSWGTAAYATEADQLSIEEEEILPDFHKRATMIKPVAGDHTDPDQIAFSDDATLLARVTDYGEWVVYKVGSWREILHKKTTLKFARVMFLPDSHLLALTDIMTGLMEDNIEQIIWDIDYDQKVEMPYMPGLSHSKSGRYTLDYGLEGSLRLLDREGSEERVIDTKPGQKIINDASCSPDDKVVATCQYCRDIYLWNMESGQLIRTYAAGDGVRCLSFSGDGKYLAVGADSFCGILSMEDGRFVRKLKGHVDMVKYSLDGHYLAVVYVDDKTGRGGQILIFETGQCYGSKQADGPLLELGRTLKINLKKPSGDLSEFTVEYREHGAYRFENGTYGFSDADDILQEAMEKLFSLLAQGYKCEDDLEKLLAEYKKLYNIPEPEAFRDAIVALRSRVPKESLDDLEKSILSKDRIVPARLAMNRFMNSLEKDQPDAEKWLFRALGAGASLDYEYYTGNTPIQLAVTKLNKRIVALLASLGAELLEKTYVQPGYPYIYPSLLLRATTSTGEEAREIEDILREAGAVLSPDDQLHAAIYWHDLKRAKEAIEAGACPAGPYPHALFAIVSNNRDMVTLLVEKGADKGELFYYAIDQCYDNFYGGDPKRLENYSEWRAYLKKTAQWLIDQGADPSWQHFFGRTALDIAIRNRDNSAKKWLIELGAKQGRG